MRVRRCSLHRVLLAIATVLTSTAARADPTGFWLQNNLTIRLSEKWSLATDLQPRWEDGDGSPDRALTRPALVHEPVKGLTFWLGTGATFIRDEPDDQLLWQQVAYVFPAGSWTLTPRVRVEERFVQDTTAIGWRVRLQLRAVRPLRPSSRWSVVTWHESFLPINTVDAAQRRGYDEGRTFIGVQRRVSAHLIVEPGYMGRFTNEPPPGPNTWTNAVHLTLGWRF